MRRWGGGSGGLSLKGRGFISRKPNSYPMHDLQLRLPGTVFPVGNLSIQEDIFELEAYLGYTARRENKGKRDTAQKGTSKQVLK